MSMEREKPEFTVNVSELDAAGKDYDFVVRAAWVRGTFEDHEATTSGEDGALKARASKSGHDVVVHGTLVAELQVPCARCLEPTKVPINSELSVLYVPAATLKAEADENESIGEDADTLPFSGDTVVLDDLVHDELLLGVPMIPLCREDCPGMSPAPEPEEGKSTDKPIDPRLAPLLAFSARKPK